MRHQISADPANGAVIHIGHLKQGGDPGVTGTTINVEYIGHPPVIAAVIADDHGHPRSHTEKYRLRPLQRHQGMVNGHPTASKQFTCTTWTGLVLARKKALRGGLVVGGTQLIQGLQRLKSLQSLLSLGQHRLAMGDAGLNQ